MNTKELLKAADYWRNFDTLPVSDSEMIAHLARFAKLTKKAKVYKRKINSNMALALIVMYRYSHGGFVHMENLIADAGHNRCGDATYLQHFGLIEKLTEERADGCPHNGMYRITELGKMFVENKSKVKQVLIYSNKQVKGFDGEKVGIETALSTKFNYSKLMGLTA